MAEHILNRSLTLELPREQVFEFFSDAGNLERITPPELSFHIVTLQPLELRQGTLIDYKLRLRGLPLTWMARVAALIPDAYVADEAQKLHSEGKHAESVKAAEEAHAMLGIATPTSYRPAYEVPFLIRHPEMLMNRTSASPCAIVRKQGNPSQMCTPRSRR